MNESANSVRITMISDFICPWCRIGEKRLADAIEALPDDISVSLEMKPFELNPDMPQGGMDRHTYRSLKFGSWERSQQLDAGTVAAGAADGVTFNYDILERTPNTFAAHKLTHWAKQHGDAVDVARRILAAYFVEGRDIGSIDVLAKIAEEAGLDPYSARTYLIDPDADGELRESLREVRKRGVHSVPQFDVEGTIIHGAQSASELAEAISAAAIANAQGMLHAV
ncbi:MAG: DsbA family oxidoreductase [Pseudomonadota bacterium]